MKESVKTLRERARKLRLKGAEAIRQADALFERAKALEARGRTPLQSALLAGKKAEAKSLLGFGADPNETGEEDERPPIVLAFDAFDEKTFSPSLVMALIKAGANPNAKRPKSVRIWPGVSILASAFDREAFGLALDLLKAGADPTGVSCSRGFGKRDITPEQKLDREIFQFGELVSKKERAIAEEIRELLTAFAEKEGSSIGSNAAAPTRTGKKRERL